MNDRKRLKSLEKKNKFYSRGATKKRAANASKMAEYERLAKQRGVPVARVIAEAIG
jgi:L-alanine-DL-glutamate epimerase-like enolase superfamily enzyme